MKKFYSNKLAIVLFAFPALLVFTVMVFYPIVQAFVKSFYEWNGLGSGTFIGFDNYTKLFGDTVFKLSNKNALIFALVITVFQMTLASIFALVVSNKKVKGRNFLRVAYFIPVVLSVTVVCQLWLAILNADTGLLNAIFKALGINYEQNWLSDRHHAIYVIAFVNAWQWMGYQFALMMAGIKSIPNDYYEAARIDGASTLQAHSKVTIPLLKETYKICLTISLTGGVKAFTEMFIMTKGGPGNATYTLTYLMYKAAFREYRYGYGMASASILVIQCLVIILVINWLFRDKEDRRESRWSKKTGQVK
ncbi:carbohydrate ABC transporter permease [Anaeromicropila populeti]|uniref:Raffinose/stachyose/melibiose transport system permease protein n=1 Tax=Anaeromicropila populeti TaxID=37658 RepID=A0A1I6IQ73_9FIRM|nr:sugar ABC transporter permease [Anaeromicropila populeti]SFR68801.1 raffinose/stachyose/melibiose transport system permease protein [Anaeromicropila populeti]